LSFFFQKKTKKYKKKSTNKKKKKKNGEKLNKDENKITALFLKIINIILV